MRIFYGFDNLSPIIRPIVTIGSYDGVHHGHREILAHVCHLARQQAGESVVITFHPHPRLVLHKDHTLRQLNTLPEKLELLSQVGIQNIIIIPFTEAFSRLEADEFVRDYLVQKLHMDTLEIGYDHHLGHGQQGDFHTLTLLAEQYGFRVEQISQQRLGDHQVSSTVIRQLITSGQLTEAARYLEAPYPLSGYLQQDGSLTNVEPTKLLPPAGHYPCRLYPHASPRLDESWNEVSANGIWHHLETPQLRSAMGKAADQCDHRSQPSHRHTSTSQKVPAGPDQITTEATITPQGDVLLDPNRIPLTWFASNDSTLHTDISVQPDSFSSSHRVQDQTDSKIHSIAVRLEFV